MEAAIFILLTYVTLEILKLINPNNFIVRASKKLHKAGRVFVYALRAEYTEKTSPQVRGNAKPSAPYSMDKESADFFNNYYCGEFILLETAENEKAA